MTEDTTDKGPILFIDVSEEGEQFLKEITSKTVTSQEEAEKVKEEPDTSDGYPLVQTRRVRCKICKRYTAENEEKMVRHIRKVHRGENPFQCYMCDYSTYNKTLFEDHVRMHQGIKPFKCSHCPYRSVSKKNTKKHELIHRPNNPLSCQDCTFIARNSRALNCHRMKNHLECEETVEGYKCTKCNTVFTEVDAYKNHMKGRKKCHACDTTFCGHLIKTHRSDVHGVLIEEVKKRRRKVTRFSYKCKVCKWSSNTKARFLLHLIHHPVQDLSDCEMDLSVLRKYGILQPVGGGVEK